MSQSLHIVNAGSSVRARVVWTVALGACRLLGRLGCDDTAVALSWSMGIASRNSTFFSSPGALESTPDSLTGELDPTAALAPSLLFLFSG